MKTTKWIIVALFGAFIGFVVYMAILSSRQEPEPTVKPQMRDIARDIIVSGSIMPSKEIDVKSSFPGVVERLLVREGETVHKGQAMARLRFVTEPQAYQSNLRRFQIAKAQYDKDKHEYERSRYLFEKGVVSPADHEAAMATCLTSKAEYEAALREWQFVRGDVPESDSSGLSNIIAATAEGTVLELPVKEGGSVMARGSLSEGTTVARIARLDALIFRGYVAEADINRLHEGMSLRLMMDAVRDEEVTGKLQLIAPKGDVHDGIVKFEIEAEVLIPEQFKGTIRAGYTANAVITVEEQKNVLSVEEKNLIFSDDSTYVETPAAQSGKWRKTPVITGISDGIYTEITAGLDTASVIRVQNSTKEETK